MAAKEKTINVENRASEAAQDRFWFLESMDQLSRAMQDTEDLEQLSHVLDAVLSIFGCDRAWLADPSDAVSRRWRTVAQRACPEFADTPSLDLNLPMDPEIAEVFRLVEASEVAVRFSAGGDPLSSVVARARRCVSPFIRRLADPTPLAWTSASRRGSGPGRSRSCSRRQAGALRRCLPASSYLATCKRARPGWKKHNASHMWGTGTGTLKRMSSSGQMRPIVFLGSNGESVRWTLKRSAHWSTRKTGRPSTAQWMWSWMPACIRLPTFGSSLQAEKCARCMTSPQSFGVRFRDIRAEGNPEKPIGCSVPFKTSRN